jgi:hypothetical protein
MSQKLHHRPSPLITTSDRKGHQERFPPPGVRNRDEFREETIAGKHRNERAATIPAIRGTATEPQGSRDYSGHSRDGNGTAGFDPVSTVHTPSGHRRGIGVSPSGIKLAI